MLRCLVLVALVAAVTASGGVFEDGPCPPIKTQPNFDFSSYSGTWYEIAKFPNIGEDYDKGKCTTAEYYIDGNRGKVKNTHVVDGVKSYIEGDLTLIGPAKVMITYTFGDKAKNSYLYVLETDYNNYSIGYSCRYFKKSRKHQLYSWIKSRSKTLEGNAKVAVETFLKENSKIIDASKYVLNDHCDQACKVYTTQPITHFYLDETHPDYVE